MNSVEIILLALVVSLIVGLAISCLVVFTKPDIKKEKLPDKDPRVEIVDKGNLPFDTPFPRERLVAVLYRSDLGAYCLFSIVYPELHITIKFIPEKNLTQEELTVLTKEFVGGFVKNLKPRYFLDEKRLTSGIH